MAYPSALAPIQAAGRPSAPLAPHHCTAPIPAAVTAQQAGPANAGQAAQAENFLTGALRQLFALVENYPELKANQNVLELQEELTTTENQIGFSRQHYNASVREFNTSVQTFPTVLIASMFGFRERDYFQIEEADTAVPEVNLRTT